jgi:tetracycline repressor-like protein
MFDAIIDRMGSEDVPDGCLMINATVECDGSSNRIETVVAESIVKTEARLKEEIDRAIRSKQIPIHTDSERLARFFAAIALSLGVAHRLRKTLADCTTSSMSRCRVGRLPSLARQRVLDRDNR